MMEDSPDGSSPANDSPTPACGVASATARLRLVDDESPIRRVPGQSRSLKAGPDGAGLFATAERKRQPSSPLKFATASYSMDEDDSNSQPPTPTTTTSAIPQPLFTAAKPTSTASATLSVFGGKPQESRIPRLTTSQPLRARSGTTVEADNRQALGGKKAISLDRIPVPDDSDEPFGSPFGIPTPATGRKLRMSHGPIGSTSSYRAHKRINSGDQHNLLAGNSMSRSQGLKSGLALSLSPNSLKLPEFGSSNSSLSSMSTNNLTPPVSALSPAEPPMFAPLKPLEEESIIPEQTVVEHKFKPRDSGVSMGDDDDNKSKLHPHTSLTELGTRQRRPPMLKRTSSAGDERPIDNPLETPSDGPSPSSGWPSGGNFKFVGENGEAMNMRLGAPVDDKPMMPGTPVKKQAYSGQHPRMGHSNSQPSLLADWPESGPSRSAKLDNKRDRKSAPSAFMPPPSTTKKPSAKNIPHLVLTATSPDSPCNSMDTDMSSPTVRLSSHAASSSLGPIAEVPSRVGMLRRLSSGVDSGESSMSEDEGTPTKHGGDKYVLAAAQSQNMAVTSTPTPKTNLAAAVRSSKSILPRMSLPAAPPAPPRGNRTLHHRQSHPATSAAVQYEEEDIFEQRFIVLDTIGKGAFSTVLRVQERHGEGIYAVKKARGVFEGARDR
jgi:mitosis inhibitor protein kinase SWE1